MANSIAGSDSISTRAGPGRQGLRSWAAESRKIRPARQGETGPRQRRFRRMLASRVTAGRSARSGRRCRRTRVRPPTHSTSGTARGSVPASRGGLRPGGTRCNTPAGTRGSRRRTGSRVPRERPAPWESAAHTSNPLCEVGGDDPDIRSAAVSNSRREHRTAGRSLAPCPAASAETRRPAGGAPFPAVPAESVPRTPLGQLDNRRGTRARRAAPWGSAEPPCRLVDEADAAPPAQVPRTQPRERSQWRQEYGCTQTCGIPSATTTGVWAPALCLGQFPSSTRPCAHEKTRPPAETGF